MRFQTTEGFELAGLLKRGGSPSVVFVHGLGAAKNSFDPFFEDKTFGRFTLASVDLPGCGHSDHPMGFSYSMKDQANLVLNWIRDLALTRIVLVGHSMGGVICLLVAEKLGSRVTGFLNLEGNLGYEDCTYSKQAAAMSQLDFELKGYKEFTHRLENRLQQKPSPGLKNYVENISRTYPIGLYLSSRSLVEESRHGNLKERFVSLPVKKWYVFGERSMNPLTRDYLETQGIAYHVVTGSGHFMMDDQPDLFRNVVFETIETLAVDL